MIVHKLGKQEPRIDHRTLKMARYRIPGLVIPPEVSWVTKVNSWEMFYNDILGDCVPAAMAHTIMQWTRYAGNPIVPTQANVLKAYEDIGGYVPDDPTNPQSNATDNGCVMLDALNYWRTTGIAGHKILAFVSVNPLNADEVREAVYLFGNVFTGIQLPTSVQGFNSWTVPDGGTASQNGQPGSWGGHCIPIVAVSPKSRTFISWATVMKMSPKFQIDYVDEMWAIVSLDWIEKNGLSPSQFNLAQLEADLKIVTA